MADDNSIFDLMDWDQPSTENSTVGNEQPDNSPNISRHSVWGVIEAGEVEVTSFLESSNLDLSPWPDTQAPFHDISNTTLSFHPDSNQDLGVSHCVNRTTDGNITSTNFLRYHDTFPNPNVSLPSEASNSNGVSRATLEGDSLRDFSIAPSLSLPLPNDLLDLSLLDGTQNSTSNTPEATLDFTHDGNPTPHSGIASDDVMNSDIVMVDASLAENNENEAARSLGNTNIHRDENASSHGTRRRRTRFSRFQKDTLERWISGHAEPYPTRNELMELAQKTGLEVRQVRSWFTRTRQRSLRRIDVPSSRGRSRIQRSQDINNGGNSASHLRDGFFSQRSWPSCASLPIRQKSPSPSRLCDRRSHSLPSYYTLRNLCQRLHHKNSKTGSSLDAMPSMTDGVHLPLGHYSKSTVEQKTHPELTFPHELVSPKATFIVEWLKGIPLHCPLPLQPRLPSPQSPPVPSPSGFADIYSENGHSLIHPKRIRKRIPIRIPKRTFDNESTAWSNSQSASSAGSYISLGSRRGRRQKFHPSSPRNSSAQSRSDKDSDARHPSTASCKRCSSSSDSSSLSSEKRSGASRAPTPAKNSVRTNPNARSKLYSCTFCRTCFGSKFSWRRHEESVHAPQIQWICRPRQVGQSNFGEICPLCQSPTYCCPHSFDRCWEKPEKDRIFYRKDALRQHIQLVHCTPSDRYLLDELQLDEWADEWAEEVDTSGNHLRCHFCGKENDTWNARADHLSDHFKAGMTINEWIPGGPYLVPDRFLLDHMDRKDRIVYVALFAKNLYAEDHSEYSQRIRPHPDSDLQLEYEWQRRMRILGPLPPKKSKRFAVTEDVFGFPRWTRHRQGTVEAWCGICRPGQWLKGPFQLSEYECHMLFVHGERDGHYESQLPLCTRPLKANPTISEGLCGGCHIWIPLVSNGAQWKSWFIHQLTVSVKAHRNCTQRLIK